MRKFSAIFAAALASTPLAVSAEISPARKSASALPAH